MAPLLSTPLLLRTQSDRRLVMLAADGHDRAFEVIVERYRRPLQRYLRRLLSEALAEDVLQASFVRAWQALRAGTDVRDLRPWLYRIAHNQALNTLRAAGSALPAATEELPAVSLEAHVERREELRETLHGIQALPDRQRAALVAVAVADRPHADVAAELGMSDGALRQLLLRARTALRAAASALTPYPLLTWLAGTQDVSAARVAEVAVGAGGAGVGIKAGAAVLAAGAIVAGGPALRSDHQQAPAEAKAKAAPPSAQADGPAAPRHAAAVILPAASADHQAGDQAGALGGKAGQSGDTSSKRHSRSGEGGDDSTSHRSGSSGKGSGDASGPDSGSGDDSGEGDSGSGSSGSSGSHESSGTGSSGMGSSGGGDGDGAEIVTTSEESGPEPETIAPASDTTITSGEGSGSSGSDGSGGGGSGDGGPGGDGSGHDGSGGD